MMTNFFVKTQMRTYEKAFSGVSGLVKIMDKLKIMVIEKVETATLEVSRSLGDLYHDMQHL